MQKIGGFRRKTRHKLHKAIRSKGKISITRYFQKFNDGDKVVLKAEPAVQKGMCHPRFHGKTGIVSGQTGACYHVDIKDGGKQKVMVVHPIHLMRVIK